MEVRGHHTDIGSLVVCGFGNRIQAVRLGGKDLYLLNHLVSPIFCFVFEKENIFYCQEGLYGAHSHLELLGSEILRSQLHHTVPVREVLSLSPSCPKVQRCPIFDSHSKAKFQLIMTHKSLKGLDPTLASYRKPLQIANQASMKYQQ